MERRINSTTDTVATAISPWFRARPRRGRGGSIFGKLIVTCAVLCALQLQAAELRVRGLGWFGNRKSEQRLKLLLGEVRGPTLDANAIEDAALVLISSVNDDGYLEPKLTAHITLKDGTTADYPLDATLEHSLPRPLEATAATLSLNRGKRFTLQEITFTGLLALTEKDARGFFVGEGLLIPLASERIYSPGRLQRAESNLEEALRQQGYAEAAVTTGNVQIDHATGKVRAEIKVHEGRLWKVTAVSFSVADHGEAPEKIAVNRIGEHWTSLWRQDTATAIRRWYYMRGHPDVQRSVVGDGTQGPLRARQGVHGSRPRIVRQLGGRRLCGRQGERAIC